MKEAGLVAIAVCLMMTATALIVGISETDDCNAASFNNFSNDPDSKIDTTLTFFSYYTMVDGTSTKDNATVASQSVLDALNSGEDATFELRGFHRNSTLYIQGLLFINGKNINVSGSYPSTGDDTVVKIDVGNDRPMELHFISSYPILFVSTGRFYGGSVEITIDGNETASLSRWTSSDTLYTYVPSGATITYSYAQVTLPDGTTSNNKLTDSSSRWLASNLGYNKDTGVGSFLVNADLVDTINASAPKTPNVNENYAVKIWMIVSPGIFVKTYTVTYSAVNGIVTAMTGGTTVKSGSAVLADSEVTFYPQSMDGFTLKIINTDNGQIFNRMVENDNGSFTVKMREVQSNVNIRFVYTNATDKTVYNINMPDDGRCTFTSASILPMAFAGDDYTFKMTVNDGFVLDHMTVTANGTVLTPDDEGRYTISNIQADQNVEVTGIDTIFDVVFENNDGTTLSYDGKPVQGQSYVMTITPQDGYVIDNVVVTMNGTTVENAYKNGIVVIDNVDGDVAISVTTRPVSSLDMTIVYVAIVIASIVALACVAFYRRKKEAAMNFEFM